MYLPRLKLGSQGDLVQRFQRGLASLTHHPGPADGLYGPDTERAVVILQYAAKVLTDGIAGPVTLRAYNDAIGAALKRSGRLDLYDYRIPLSYDSHEPLAPPEGRLQFRGIGIGPPPAGYKGERRYVVRRDVLSDLGQLNKSVQELGGALNSDRWGSKRSLGSKASQYRSRASFHYLGRAFDLHNYGAMQDPASDPFVVTKGEGRRWTVWCRSTKKLPPVSLTAQVVLHEFNRRGKSYTQVYEREVEGAFFNFTELAGRFGFRPVPVRRSFLMGNALVGADWWHFRWERGLVWGGTTFGEELRKCYPLERIHRDFHYWEEVRHFRYGLEWL